ncbi:MAG: 16S rRNA (guanine(527)-N(7))-methyltransferase RsmG [Coriobacteriia bacterium]|nr:16S rRNA (guanine(527)-N(7))-methyltransferase RsmG [Coriobacteriia bacterium]
MSDANVFQILSEKEQILLKEALLFFNIEISDEQTFELLHYLDLLLVKNQTLNLTAIKDPKDAVILHLVDSLLFIKMLPLNLNGSLLDMGSGGGLPGIPLAIVSNLSINLLDSVAKKTRAQEEFINALQLTKARAFNNRIELFSKENKYKYDYVTARALAPLNVLIEYASPLLPVGGSLIVSKSIQIKEELREAEKALKLCGFKLHSSESFNLPYDYGYRELLLFKKVKLETIALPRSNGKAKNQPLT